MLKFEGLCDCYFCENGKPHPINAPEEWREEAWPRHTVLFIKTRVCKTCTHEEPVAIR